MIINVGSINIDHVYRVGHLPEAGETIAAVSHQKFLGGKGINQSIAISKSGGELIHIGAVGPDGEWVLSEIHNMGVDTRHIRKSGRPTGHAVICVDDAGENQIVIYSGANHDIDLGPVQQVFRDHGGPENWALIQNETNATTEIAKLAKKNGLNLAYSAAPFEPEKIPELIGLCDLLVVNELEAAEICSLTGKELGNLPVAQLVVTMGSKGATYHAKGETIQQEAFPVEPVDTTGAGDTFLGAFLASFSRGEPAAAALGYAAAASAIQVTRPGAAAAIPERDTVLEFLERGPVS